MCTDIKQNSFFYLIKSRNNGHFVICYFYINFKNYYSHIMHMYILNFKLLVTIKFNHLLIEWIHTDGLTDVLFPLVCERLDYKQIKKQ